MNGWFIVELLGHRRHVGYVEEVEVLGGQLGKVEALTADGTTVTVFFSSASVYSITSITEAAAREMVKPYSYNPAPLPEPDVDPFEEE